MSESMAGNYLIWIYEHTPMKGSLYRGVKRYIEENLEDLKKEAKNG